MRFTSGLPETLCGAGSTLGATAYLRPRLQEVLRGLEVKVLLDAPCGDFNWMSAVDLEGIQYVGADCNVDNLIAAHNRSTKEVFHELDIIADDLPDADAMLCRDFYQHLPDKMVFSALRNFLASGIPWLLATFHDNPVNEDIEEAGMFRRVNLTVAPFSFPEPKIAIADPPDSGHFLGVWSRLDVMRAIT